MCEVTDSLFAANLHDQRIYRLALPGGEVLDRFAHGAATEPWAANARLFGLGCQGGWLYHGVVDSRQDPIVQGALSAHIYRSRADGSDMSNVAVVPLDYDRRPRWQPWEEGLPVRPDVMSQPLLSDIEFVGNGDLAPGLADRTSNSADAVYGNGDILPAYSIAPGIGDVESLRPPATPLYLPLAVARSCVSALPVDVVLVLDMSSSMRRPGRYGTPKYRAAIRSALSFVALLELNPVDARRRNPVSV